jgi:hypothetical protein
MIKMILQAVLHSQEKNRKALLSNYWSSRESRDTFELKWPDWPTDGASFFFLSLFVFFFFFFFCVCKLWQKRERERGTRSTLYCEFLLLLLLLCSRLRRPTSTEPEGRNLRQKQRKVVALQQQQPATPPTNKRTKHRPLRSAVAAPQWQQHCARCNSRAGAWLSSRHSVHVYYTTDITEVNFFLSWSHWV